MSDHKKNKTKEDLNATVDEEAVFIDELDVIKNELKVANSKVDQLQKLVDENKLRTLAEVENTRRRISEQFENRVKYANKDLLLNLLGVVDNFQRAMSDQSDDVDGYKKGVAMIYDQLLHVLSESGVEKIMALGETFDANLHHCLIKEEDNQAKPDTVIAVLQEGYMYKQMLLRPAQVKVSVLEGEEENE